MMHFSKSLAADKKPGHEKRDNRRKSGREKSRIGSPLMFRGRAGIKRDLKEENGTHGKKGPFDRH
jgi:hypothetical protein